MNIFQKIGNNFEKEKKEKELIKKRYWGLSSSERMEYDLKKEKIFKDYFGTFLTFDVLKLFIGMGIFLFIFGFAFEKLFVIIPLIKLLFLIYFKFLLWLILLDLLLVILGIPRVTKERKKLRKRFKLC